MPWPFLLMEPTLSSMALNNRLLSTVLSAVWILVVMVNPSLIHSNQSMHKMSFIFVKTLQALFRDFHASAFLICCKQAGHPSCTKLFYIQFFMQNTSYTFFWNAYSLSNFIHQSFNTISCTCSMISGVALFGHPSRGSSSRLVRSRLNSAAHFWIVENEGE